MCSSDLQWDSETNKYLDRRQQMAREILQAEQIGLAADTAAGGQQVQRLAADPAAQLLAGQAPAEKAAAMLGALAKQGIDPLNLVLALGEPGGWGDRRAGRRWRKPGVAGLQGTQHPGQRGHVQRLGQEGHQPGLARAGRQAGVVVARHQRHGHRGLCLAQLARPNLVMLVPGVPASSKVLTPWSTPHSKARVPWVPKAAVT